MRVTGDANVLSTKNLINNLPTGYNTVFGVDCTVVLTVLDIGVEVHQLIQDAEELVSWVQNSQYPAYTVSVTDSNGFTSNVTFTPESVSEVDSLTGEVIATWDILVCVYLFIYLHFSMEKYIFLTAFYY